MGLKFFALALIAVLSLQGFASAKHISVVDERGIIEDIGKVVEEIKAAVAKTIIEAITAVKNAFDQIMAIAKDELNKAMAAIKQNVEEALAELKHLEELAMELGYDIKDCVDAEKPRIHELAQKTQEGVQKCVADLAAEFQKMYEDLLKVTSAAYETIFALVVAFDECTDMTCRYHVGAELIEEMNAINSHVRSIVDKAIRTMQEKIPDVVKCIRVQVQNLKTGIATIVSNIKTCVEASTEQQIATKSIQEELAKLIAQVKQAMKDVVEEGVASIKKAYAEIVAFAQELAVKAEQKIHEMAAKLYEDIEAIKEQAKELHINIEDCVQEAIPKIQALIAQTEAEINKCIESTLGTAEDIYEQVIAIVEEIDTEVTNLINAAAQCTNIGCYIDIIKGFRALFEKISGEIKDLIVNSSAEIQEALENLSVCVGPSLDRYVTGMQTIAEEFKKCFESKQ